MRVINKLDLHQVYIFYREQDFLSKKMIILFTILTRLATNVYGYYTSLKIMY
jgi:hypothetical protein